MTPFILSVLAYAVLSMAFVSFWHFVLFKRHYDSVTVMRKQPLMQLGLLTMLLQGTAWAYLYPLLHAGSGGSPAGDGLLSGIIVLALLGSYLTLAEAGKYEVGAVKPRILVEGAAALIQFPLIGLVIGLIHQ